MSKKKKNTISRKEKTEQFISKWAFAILFALVIELAVYVVVLNIVPTFVSKTIDKGSEELTTYSYNPQLVVDEANDKYASLNKFYTSERKYTSNGYFENVVDNPTWLIYYYNNFLLVATLFLLLYYIMHKLEESWSSGKGFLIPFIKKEWPFCILFLVGLSLMH